MADSDDIATAFAGLMQTVEEGAERQVNGAFIAFGAAPLKEAKHENAAALAKIDDEAIRAMRETFARDLEDARRAEAKLLADDREQRVREAIGIVETPKDALRASGLTAGHVRLNAVELLEVAAAVLRGQIGPSPALAEWFADAVGAIAAGKPADDAFGTKRAPGRYDPVATRHSQAAHDTRLLAAVDQARREGYPTSPNSERESCFEVATERLGVGDEKDARSRYYRHEFVESLSREDTKS